MITYDIRLNACAHTMKVRMKIATATEEVILGMPVWLPGSYSSYEFSRHIIEIKLISAGKIENITPHKYKITNTDKHVELEYEVYTYDFSVRGSYIDTNLGFINASSLCLYVENLQHKLHTIKINNQGIASAWKLRSLLSATDVDACGFGEYSAACYDELIDEPIVMGEFQEEKFLCEGVEHFIAVFNAGSSDLVRLRDDVQKICHEQYKMFGSFGFKQYLFILIATTKEYGGLEHKNSTMLMCNQNCLPYRNGRENKNYKNLLGLFSHEYFHSWNVKRIRPHAMVPFDLSTPQYTTQLWIFEGFTSYYDDLMLFRAGVISRKEYLTILAERISQYLRTPGHTKQKLTDSSFYTWTKFYKRSENTINSAISYYLKGALLALLLDMSLIKGSGGNKSLADLMRHLWKEYGLAESGLPEDEVAIWIRDNGDTSTNALLDLGINTTECLPFKETFKDFGIDFHCVINDGKSKGEYCEKLPDLMEGAYLGVIATAHVSYVKVNNVLIGSPAHDAGIAAQDEIIAINNVKCTKDNWPQLLEEFVAGDKVVVALFRRGRLFSFELLMSSCPLTTAILFQQPNLDAQQKQNMVHWLS